MIYIILILCLVAGAAIFYAKFTVNKYSKLIKDCNDSLSAMNEVDKEVIAINERNRAESERLLIVKNQAIQELTNCKNSYDDWMSRISAIQEQAREQKELLEADAEKYEAKLQELYQERKAKVDKDIEQLDISFEEYKKEIAALRGEEEDQLQQIKNRRQSAMEAIRREEELKQERERFTLSLSERQQLDIKILKSIQDELIKPENIDKFIWSYYYKPIAKEKFTKIIGKQEVMGIYKITCLATEQVYIGQAKKVSDRWVDHVKYGLGAKPASNNKLYEAMKKYGVAEFAFELLEECEEEQLNEEERKFIELYDSYNFGLNGNSGVSKE